MEKIRELSVDGVGPYRVSNVRGIVDPGKFEGEALHAVRDYDSTYQDEDFGDVSEWGAFYWKAGHRYYMEGDSGFVTEVDERDYRAAEESYSADMERAEALDEARNALEEAQAEDVGTCDACEALVINGVRCHESGCPREGHLRDLSARVTALENA